MPAHIHVHQRAAVTRSRASARYQGAAHVHAHRQLQLITNAQLSVVVAGCICLALALAAEECGPAAVCDRNASTSSGRAAAGAGPPRRRLAAAPDATSSLDCQPRIIPAGASLACTLLPRAAGAAVSAPAAAFVLYPPSGPSLALASLAVPASADRFVFSIPAGDASGPLAAAAHATGAANNASVPIAVTAEPDGTTSVELPDGGALAVGASASATIVLRRGGRAAYADRSSVASIAVSGALSSAALLEPRAGLAFTLAATVAAGPASETGAISLTLSSGLIVSAAGTATVYAEPDITSVVTCPNVFLVLSGGPVDCTIRPRLGGVPVYALRTAFQAPVVVGGSSVASYLGSPQGAYAAREFTAAIGFSETVVDSAIQFNLAVGARSPVLVVVRGKPTVESEPYTYYANVLAHVESGRLTCPATHLFANESTSCALVPLEAEATAADAPVTVGFGAEFQDPDASLYGALEEVQWPAYDAVSNGFSVRVRAGPRPGNGTLSIQFESGATQGSPLEQRIFVWSLPDATSSVRCPSSPLVARGTPVPLFFEARAAGQSLPSVPWAFAGRGFASAQTTGRLAFEPEDFEAYAVPVETAAATATTYPSLSFDFAVSTSGVPTGPARLAARLALAPAGSPPLACPVFLHDAPDNSTGLSCLTALIKAGASMNCSILPRRAGERVHALFASLSSLTSTGAAVTIAGWAEPSDALPRRAFNFTLVATDATGPAALQIPLPNLPTVAFPLTVFQDPDDTSTVDCGGSFLVAATAANCTVRPKRAGRPGYSPSSAFALELRPRAGRRLLATALPLPSGVSDAFVVGFTAPATGLFELSLAVAGSPAAVTLPLQTQLEVGGLAVTAPSLLGLLDPLRVSASLASGSDTTFAWSFGDGGFASGASASHFYAANGTYLVSLTAANNVSALRWSQSVLVEAPVEGLALETGSPVPWKAAARLRATVQRGSNVKFVIRVLDAGGATAGPFVFPSASAEYFWPQRGQYRVQVEASNAVYKDTLNATVVVEAFELLALDPAAIPSAGQVSVTVKGRRFVNGAALRCQFGSGASAEVLEARYLTPESISCIAPAHPAGNSTVSVAYDTIVPNLDNTLQLGYLTCKPGEAQANYRFPCEPCRPGTYSADGLPSSCPHCPDGTYQPEAGQASCLSCPENAGTIAGAYSLQHCVCRPQFWGTAYSGGSCTACPDGTDCGRMNTTYPPAVRGRWISRTDATLALKCDPPEACPGGVEQCNDGFFGFRCGQCAPGFYRINGQCTSCSGKEPPFVGIVSIFLAIVFAYCIFSARSFSRTDKIGDSAEAIQTFVQLLQAFSLIAQSRLNWPPIVKMLAGWLTALNINPQIARPECSAGAVGSEAFLLQWKLTLAAPLILIAAGVAQLAFLLLWSRCAWRVYNGLRRLFPCLRPLEDEDKAEDAKEGKEDGRSADGDKSHNSHEERRSASNADGDGDDVVSTASRAAAPLPSYALPPETCMQTLDEMEAVLLRLRASRRVVVKADDKRLATAAAELEDILETVGSGPLSAPASRETAERLWRAVATLRDVPTGEFEGKLALAARAERSLRALRPEPPAAPPVALPERLGWACDDLLDLIGGVRAGVLADDDTSTGSSAPKPAPDGRMEWCAKEAEALAEGEPDTVFADRMLLLVRTASEFDAADFGTELHAPVAARLERALGHLYELCVLQAFKPQGPDDDEMPRGGFFAAAARRLRRVGRSLSQRPGMRSISTHLLQSRARFRRILGDGLRKSARFRGDLRTWTLIILVHVQAAGIFYNIAFQQIAQMTLAPFVCRENVNGDSFLAAEPAIPCRPGEQPWAGMRGVSILATVVYLGIVPALLCFASWYFYARVDTWAGEAHHEEMRGRHLNRFGIPRMLFCKALFGFLVLSYRHELCYWGLVVLARRFAIVVVQTFTPLDKNLTQALLNFLIVFIALLLQAWRKPFGEQRGNRMALAALMAYMFQLFAGLIFVYPDIDETTSLVTQVVLLASFLVCFVMMIRILILNQIYERKHRALFALTEAVRGELRLNSAVLVAIDPWWQRLHREKKHLMQAYVQNVAEIVRSDVCGKDEQFKGRGRGAKLRRRLAAASEDAPKPAALGEADLDAAGAAVVRDAERASACAPAGRERELGELAPAAAGGEGPLSGRRACAYLFRDKAMWGAHLIRGRRREAAADEERLRKDESGIAEILGEMRELREGGRRRKGLWSALLARRAARQRSERRDQARRAANASRHTAQEEAWEDEVLPIDYAAGSAAAASAPAVSATGNFLGEFDADPRDVTVEWPEEGVRVRAHANVTAEWPGEEGRVTAEWPEEAPAASAALPPIPPPPPPPPPALDLEAARAMGREALLRAERPLEPLPRHDEAEEAAGDRLQEEEEDEDEDDEESDEEDEEVDAPADSRDARLAAATRALRAAADEFEADPANPAAAQAVSGALAALAQLPRAAFAGDAEGHAGAIRALRALRHDAGVQLPASERRELDALLGVLVAIPPRPESSRDRRAARAVAELRAAAAAPALELRRLDRAVQRAADLPPAAFKDASFAKRAGPPLRRLRRRLKAESAPGIDGEARALYDTAIGRMLTAMRGTAAAPPPREGPRAGRLAGEIEAACEGEGPPDAPRATAALAALAALPPDALASSRRARERTLAALEQLWYRAADDPSGCAALREAVEPLILSLRQARPAGTAPRPRPHAPAAAPADAHRRFPIALARVEAALGESPFDVAKADEAVRLLLELPLDVYKGRRVSAQRAARALEDVAGRAEAAGGGRAAGLLLSARAHAAVLRGLTAAATLPRAGSAPEPSRGAPPGLPRAASAGPIRLVVSAAPSDPVSASPSPPRERRGSSASSSSAEPPSLPRAESEGRGRRGRTLTPSHSELGPRPRPALRRSLSPAPASSLSPAPAPSPRHVHFDFVDAAAGRRERSPSPGRHSAHSASPLGRSSSAPSPASAPAPRPAAEAREPSPPPPPQPLAGPPRAASAASFFVQGGPSAGSSAPSGSPRF